MSGADRQGAGGRSGLPRGGKPSPDVGDASAFALLDASARAQLSCQPGD
jgi:hypothetical protein